MQEIAGQKGIGSGLNPITFRFCLSAQKGRAKGWEPFSSKKAQAKKAADVEKSLIITEKPSVARDISTALGGFSEEDGYFESDAFVLTFAVGHLFELLAPEDVDPAYKAWTLDNLPILPERFGLKAKSGQSERIRTIRKLATRKDVAGLINACDAGREGELIFREIVNELGIDKPVRRLWLQSMTRDAIRNGFQSLRGAEEVQGLGDAAECRSYSDWLIGMNATRALTKRLKTPARAYRLVGGACTNSDLGVVSCS